MKNILLASLFLLSSVTVSASDESWVDVWGSIKNTSGLILDKTGTSAINAVDSVSASTRKTLETIKSTEIDFTVTTDSAETSNLKETLAGPWQSVTSIFSRERGQVTDSTTTFEKAKSPLGEEKIPYVESFNEREGAYVQPYKEIDDSSPRGYFDKNVKEINVIEVFD